MDPGLGSWAEKGSSAPTKKNGGIDPKNRAPRWEDETVVGSHPTGCPEAGSPIHPATIFGHFSFFSGAARWQRPVRGTSAGQWGRASPGQVGSGRVWPGQGGKGSTKFGTTVHMRNTEWDSGRGADPGAGSVPGDAAARSTPPPRCLPFAFAATVPVSHAREKPGAGKAVWAVEGLQPPCLPWGNQCLTTKRHRYYN